MPQLLRPNLALHLSEVVSRRLREIIFGLSFLLDTPLRTRFRCRTSAGFGETIASGKKSKASGPRPLFSLCYWKRYSSLLWDIAPSASRVVSQTPVDPSLALYLFVHTDKAGCQPARDLFVAAPRLAMPHSSNRDHAVRAPLRLTAQMKGSFTYRPNNFVSTLVLRDPYPLHR